MTPLDLRALVNRAGDVGKNAFETLVEFRNKIAEEIDSGELADSLVIDAATDVLASLVASSIASGKDFDEKKAEDFAGKVCTQIRDLLRNIYLESGAQILGVDLAPEDEKEEGL